MRCPLDQRSPTVRRCRDIRPGSHPVTDRRLIRRRVVVHGRVQGVFFRDTCRAEARRHGVSGWVTNRSDGAVEAVLEGEEAAVDTIVAWMHRGPDAAIVTDVEVIVEQPEQLSGFRVR